MKRYAVTVIALLLTALCSRAGAQTPTTKPSEKTTPPSVAPALEFVQTPMRVQQLAGADHYLYAEAQTTFANMHETIDTLMKQVDAARKDASVHDSSQFVFIYRGADPAANQPFTLQIGLPVNADAKATGECKIRKLESIKAAVSIYSGRITTLMPAYQKLYGELFAAGLMPTDECREVYTYWEGPESENNIVILQAGVK